MNGALTDIVDLERLAEEIGPIAAEPRPIDYAPPQYREKLPEYVAHAPGVPQIGALSAAAVVRMYEEAAAAIEALGQEERRLIEECERAIAQSHARTKEIQAIADDYREEAKRAFETIESKARLTSEITKTCESLRKKIAVEEPTA